MLRIKIFVMSALVLALLSVVPAQAASVEGINHIGLLKAINTARGKVVVVNFFATWCMPCLQEIPGLMNIRSSFSEDDVMMVSVSVDKSIEEVQDFVDTNPFNYPVYWGDDARGPGFSDLGHSKAADLFPAGCVGGEA